jgi:hypothetical protein
MPGEVGVHFEGDYAVDAGQQEFGESSLAGTDFDDLLSAGGACGNRDAIEDTRAGEEMLA